MMIDGRYVALIATLFLFLYTSLPSRAFSFHPTIHQSVSSHSGPTNALYGHEQFYDEQLSTEQRRKRSTMWGNNYFYNNEWPNLLMSSEPPSGYMTDYLSNEHNRYRRMVPATDMRMIYWSDELAASAQRHADRCDFRHSRNRVNIGENIWAAPYSDYKDALVRWFEEVNNPWCGCSQHYKSCCGHFVQMVWARTDLVGCGYARCRDVWGVLGRGHQHVFVCHYSPQGNKVSFNGNGQLIARPAYTWAYNRSQVCSQCPPEAPACYEGLCYKPSNNVPANQTAESSNSIGSGDPRNGNLWFNMHSPVESNTLGQNRVD